MHDVGRPVGLKRKMWGARIRPPVSSHPPPSSCAAAPSELVSADTDLDPHSVGV
jgi:hypothetical protein